MTSKSSAKSSFEGSLKRLEEIVTTLERGEVSLEESITMYEEGLALSRTCLEKLAQADIKIRTMTKDMDGSFQFLDNEGDERGS